MHSTSKLHPHNVNPSYSLYDNIFQFEDVESASQKIISDITNIIVKSTTYNVKTCGRNLAEDTGVNFQVTSSIFGLVNNEGDYGLAISLIFFVSYCI